MWLQPLEFYRLCSSVLSANSIMVGLEENLPYFFFFRGSNHSLISEIYENTFTNCAKLEKIVIPESVGKISSDAFKKCKNINK